MHFVKLFRTSIIPWFASALIATAGCQMTVRRISVWIYPTLTFPERSVEIGGGDQIRVPAFDPEGDGVCIGARFVHINAETKGQLSTSNLVEWPAKIKEQIERN